MPGCLGDACIRGSTRACPAPTLLAPPRAAPPLPRQPQGWASRSLPPPGRAPPDASMAPLLDALLDHVPPPPAQHAKGGLGRAVVGI